MLAGRRTSSSAGLVRPTWALFDGLSWWLCREQNGVASACATSGVLVAEEQTHCDQADHGPSHHRDTQRRSERNPHGKRDRRPADDRVHDRYRHCGCEVQLALSRLDSHVRHYSVRVVVARQDLNFNVNPAWSPDGRRIAFVVERTFDEENDLAGNEIVTVRPDGSDQRRVVIRQLPPDTYSEIYGLDWSRRR